MPATIRWNRIAALLIAVLTALALTVTLAGPAEAAGKRQRKIHTALAVAHHQKGDPYRWGANGPRRFDCSGLVQFSYGRAGLRLPRTSDAQAHRARRVKRRHMRRGDLMFFHKRGNVYHVGIFAGWSRGRRTILHAPSTGGRVRRDPVGTNRWYAGTLRRRR